MLSANAMTMRYDVLDVPALEDEEDLVDSIIVEFMDRVCVTWAAWAFTEHEKNGLAATSLWHTKAPVSRRQINLTDDQLTRVDETIAPMNYRERKRLFVEYWQRETLPQKAKRFNQSVDEYTASRDQLLERLYYALMPDSEEWRMKIL